MKLSQRSSWGLGWLAVGLCALPGPSCGSPEKAKLDLILVSVDTLRVDRLGIYGSERAPEGRDTSRVGSLPWLAANSTTWTQAWAPAGKTVPSLGTFFTGLEPLEHGAFSHLTPVQAPSMVSALQEEGYRTFGRVANRLLGTPLGFDRGFENYAIRPRRMEVQIPEELLDLTKGPIESGEPVLAWAHFMAPHQPYEPPPQFDRWSDSDRPVKADNSLLNRIHQSPQFLTPGQREDIRAKYDGEIAFAASMVESLLAGLDAQYRAAGRGPLLENALVVFFSDHGEELADRHGYFMHAKSLYRGVTQVPLLIAGPGWESGAVKEEGISLKQVLPMLLKEHASNAVLGVSHPLDRDFIVSTWMRDFYCIRDARWTLVHAPCESRGWGPKEPPQAPFPYPEIALFDRDADPLEMRNVSDEHPEKRDELLSALGAWFDALELAPSQFVDGMSHEMLEQLGYATEAEASVCEPRRITP